ncbi:MAG: TaqI-like C-terminal specificity domain-containing protein [Bacteriovorax sp.]|nr:TaqI-like C-terminal specificity domain-containing protein [Bacteriovorax sp.]
MKGFGRIMKRGGFDAVIGNPPYLGRSTAFSNEEKRYIKSKFLSSEGKYEIFHLFMERGIKILKMDGYLSIITPQTWLSIKQATRLRRYLLENFSLIRIVSIRKSVFNASVDNVISIFQNSKKNFEIEVFEVDNKSRFKEENLEQKNLINQESLLKSKDVIIDIYFDESNEIILNKINSKSKTLDSICFVKDGVKVVGPAKSFAFSKKRIEECFFPMIKGKDIAKYHIKWNGWFCCRDKNKIEKHKVTDIRLREEFIFKRPKIVIRKTGNEVVATLDDQNYYYEQSLFSVSKKELDSGVNLKLILGILNSSLSNYLLKSNPFSKKDTFPQIRLHWLKNLPIRTIDFSNPAEKAQHDKLVALVENMLELQKKYHDARMERDKELYDRQIKLVDKQIDTLVYELYGLTEEEIKVVGW